MLVRCPSCETTYRVSDALVTSPNASFRCSRCKFVFALEAESEPDTTPEAAPSTPESSKESEPEAGGLPFSFSPTPPENAESSAQKKQEEMPNQDRLEFGKPPEAAETKSAGPKQTEFPDLRTDKWFPAPETTAGPGAFGRDPLHRSKERDEGWSISPVESAKEQAFSTTEHEPPSGIEASRTAISEFAENWERPFPSSEETGSDSLDMLEEQPASTLPYLTLFGVLLLIYAIMTLVHQTQPAVLEDLFKKIPWFGASVFQNHHLRQGIALQSLRPTYQTVQGNREVFVLSGLAYNRNRVSVREVQVEGQIFDAQGKEIGHQAIWIGNAVTPKIIKDLTAQEISILQKLSPQKRFEIPPQKAAAFTIVFLKSRSEIKNFICRILSAEGGV